MHSSILPDRLIRNIGALGLVQLTNYIAPLVILLHLTKILGVELYGVVSFSTGIVMLGSVAMDFGYSLSATNKIAIFRDNKRFVSSLIGAIFKVKLAIFALAFALILTYALLTKKYADYRLIIILSALPILLQGMQPIWFFQGIEKLKYFASFTVVAKAIFMLLVVVLIQSEEAYWLVPVLNGTGQLIALTWALIFLHRLKYRVDFRRKNMVPYALRINKGFFLSRVAVATYMQSGPVLLGLIANPAAVGIYTLAEQLYKVMQAAINPVIQAIYPYMAKERNITLYKKVSLYLVGATILCALIGVALAPSLIAWVFGDEWTHSVAVLNVFFIAIVIHVCAVLAGYPICAAVNRLQVANRSVVLGAVAYFMFFSVFYAFNLLSPISMVALMIAAESCVFIYRYLGIRPALKV